MLTKPDGLLFLPILPVAHLGMVADLIHRKSFLASRLRA